MQAISSDRTKCSKEPCEIQQRQMQSLAARKVETIVTDNTTGWGLSGSTATLLKRTRECGRQQAACRCAMAPMKATVLLGFMNHSRASRFRKLIIPLYFSPARHHLDTVVQFWATQYRKGLIN